MKIQIAFITFAAATTALVISACAAKPTTAEGRITYNLRVHYEINGKTVFSSQVKVRDGESTTATQKGKKGEQAFVEVKAAKTLEDGKPAVAMSFVIGTLSAKGERIILDTPQITTLEDEGVSMISDGTEQTTTFEVEVTRESAK